MHDEPNSIITFLLCTLLLSCSSNSNSKLKNEEKVSGTKSSYTEKQAPTPDTQDKKQRFDFGEFSVLIIEGFRHYSSFEKIKQNNDTVSLVAYAGWRRNLEIEILKNSNIESVDVFQKFENAVTINHGEQQYEHWEDFWEIDKDWLKLDSNEFLTFTLLEYDDENGLISFLMISNY